MSIWNGIWVPVVTPFAADGALDRPALAALVRSLLHEGVHGLVACGTTGEAMALDEAEQQQVLDAVLDAAGGAPVVMGVSGATPGEVAARCARWRTRRLAGFLVPPPYYLRPAASGIVEFYRQVAAAAAPHAVLVYDIPYRTGVTLELATLRELAGIDGIVGLKDCGGDARKTQALIAEGRLAVLAGEDHQIFGTLCQGGAGAIAAAAHLHPRLFVAMDRALRRGQLAEARALHHRLAPMVQAVFAEPNPAPLKSLLAVLGRIGPTLRPPFTPATAQASAALRRTYEEAAAPAAE